MDRSKNHKISAFSLIELSVVILIIGILVAGVTQGSRLVAQFRLKTAQNLTINSPVASIKNLSTWYETTLESSFSNPLIEDGAAIDTWFDINPQTAFKNNAAQAVLKRQPYFRERVINNAIPVVRFFDADIDSTGDRMTFSGDAFVSSDYTVFSVEQRSSSSAGGHFFGSDPSAGGVRCGYNANTSLFCVHNAQGVLFNVPAYSGQILRIHTFLFKNSELRYWLNGGVTPDGEYTSPVVEQLTAAPNMNLGYHALSGGDYRGDIAEIIIFSRGLKETERQEVEEYLGKKYGIVIN